MQRRHKSLLLDVSHCRMGTREKFCKLIRVSTKCFLSPSVFRCLQITRHQIHQIHRKKKYRFYKLYSPRGDRYRKYRDSFLWRAPWEKPELHSWWRINQIIVVLYRTISPMIISARERETGAKSSSLSDLIARCRRHRRRCGADEPISLSPRAISMSRRFPRSL